jgi:hypothetical protein
MRFSCEGSRCTQRFPRLPDDGDWTCADTAGATVCVGGEKPAGVAPAPADPGWTCGPRRGARRDELGKRVCRTTTPDFPEGEGAGWRCRTLHDPPLRRVCDRAPAVHMLNDPCDAQHPCVDGSRCAGDRCVPLGATPDCWLDDDCPGLRCSIGSCDEAHP